MKKAFTILVLIIGLVAVSVAQQAVITGRILDQNEKVLPGANIFIDEIGKGAVSDANGYFNLIGLVAGEYELSVTYIGFESQKKSVSLTSGQTIAVEFKLNPGVLLGEVVIGDVVQGQARAMNVQLNNPNITNVVSSDLMGQYPDANIGDALKRITGINVQYDQGEARFAHIRGTDPAMNSVMVNGERMPSAEGETRANQLDLIPSDMIQEVQVNKSLTPDMDADAIGGTVNLITRQASSNTRISATLGSGYNFLTKKPLLNGSLILGTRVANNKLGVIFSASVDNNPLGSDNIEAEWEEDDNGNVYTSDMQVRQYYLQRLRQSYTLNLDFNINEKNSIYLNGMYSNRKDWENRYRLRYKDMELNDDGTYEAEIRRQTKGGKSDIKNARLENQNVMNFTLGGKHLFGKVGMKWHGTYAKASEDRPTERYISYRHKNVTVQQDNSNPELPHVSVLDPSEANDLNVNWGLKEMTEENQFTDEVDYNGRLDFDIPILDNNFKNAIKVGVRYRGKEKQRDNNFYEYEPLDEDGFNADAMNNLSNETKNDFLPGDYQIGHFVSNEFLGKQDFENAGLFEKTAVLEEYAGNFKAKENIVAAYITLNQNFGEKLFMIVGVRLEQTGNTSEGFSYDAENEELAPTPSQTSTYLNILPNLQFKYNIRPKSVLRFAYTNTLARPDYFDLVPYQEVYLEDGEIKIGNPDLKPTVSTNLDLMFEQYLAHIGLFSAGVYYKSISNFIVEQTLRDYEYNGSVWDKFIQPVNAGDADLLGFEVAYKQTAGFANGGWKGFGWYLSYNFNYSKVKNFDLEGREDEDISLPGSPEHTANASLLYEYAGWLVRVSANYTTAFRDVEGIGESAFYDRWYDDQMFLDFNLGYSFAKNWHVYLNARNLTNQPLRYYQGVKERTMQTEYYNTNVQIGVKFDLSKPLAKKNN